jgi:hypothetical protein
MEWKRNVKALVPAKVQYVITVEFLCWLNLHIVRTLRWIGAVNSGLLSSPFLKYLNRKSVLKIRLSICIRNFAPLNDHLNIPKWIYILASKSPTNETFSCKNRENLRHRKSHTLASLTLSPTALGFSKAYSSKHKRAKNLRKKLQLSDDTLRLFYNIGNFHIWPCLIAISFQSQNPCHNKSTQKEAPQRSDLACREGGMSYRF